MTETSASLRIAFLTYRGNPYSGGQGVYTAELTRQLAALGHQVTVFSGPPYPNLDPSVELVEVPSLDLYRQPDPFRVPKLGEFHSWIDALEFGIMCTAGFPEPLTFSLRVARLLRHRRHEFDVIHDNQCLGRGVGTLVDAGWPVLESVHHPITVDRRLDLAHATTFRRRLTLRRWYGFIGMQLRVLARIPRVITVSESSRRDVARDLALDAERVAVVPVGVDPGRFVPRPEITRVPGRLMTTASADAPLKGLVPLLEALAKVRTEREDAHLVVVGRLREGSDIPRTLDRLGLTDAVRFEGGISHDRLVELYAEAEVAVVPSLYEGFSLPAIEAMACGVPLLATTGGALPEVVGTDGDTGRLVPPGDPGALAIALIDLLDDPAQRASLSAAGRRRVLERFTWRAAAEQTVEQYCILLGLDDAG
jgi:glycosyltransferase involved in cell wall biosynthesis